MATKGVSSAMQKIMKRVATAERVAAKRKKETKMKYYRNDWIENEKKGLDSKRTTEKEFKRAKQTIREQWELGPLAPRQDVGEWAGARGAIDQSRFRHFVALSLVERNRRCEWAGGAYKLNLAVGDRVVLLEGPDKGKIGLINHILHESAEVTVDGLNKTNMRIGQEIRGPEEPAAVNIELPVPISAIRLVHPLKDPVTGVTRDVIINQLEHVGRQPHDQEGDLSWSRVVPGLNVTIPWPPKPEVEHRDHPCDTLRLYSEAKTFVPTLLRPPMPLQIIDELRHKYSRFRTRHEPEYLARLEAEEQEKEKRKRLTQQSMRTPLQEFHRQERANKKKKGKPRLTLEMLEKIGEVIARNREKALNNASAAGVSDAGAAASSSAAAPSSSSKPSKKVPPPPEQQTNPSPPPPSSSST